MKKKCSAKVEVWSRVVGFYRPISQFNDGKKEEFKDRLEYKIPKSTSEIDKMYDALKGDEI